MSGNSQTEHQAVSVWPYVPHNSVKPLHDKHGACAKCQVLPPDGQTFRKCAACKSVLYCSKECQKGDWKSHRGACKLIQGLQSAGTPAPLTSGPDACWNLGKCTHGCAARGLGYVAADWDRFWPADIHRDRREAVLDEFMTLQRGNIKRTIVWLRCFLRSQHSCDLDPDNHALVFTLECRATSDGNPATRLIVKTVQGVRWQNSGVTVESANDTDTPRVRGVEPWMSNAGEGSEKPGWLWGFMKLIFVVGGLQDFAILPLDHFPTGGEAYWDPDHRPAGGWLQDLRLGTTAGLIWGEDLEEAEGQVAGVMRRKGKKWVWSKMRSAEMHTVRHSFQRSMGPEPEVDLSQLIASTGSQ